MRPHVHVVIFKHVLIFYPVERVLVLKDSVEVLLMVALQNLNLLCDFLQFVFFEAHDVLWATVSFIS